MKKALDQMSLEELSGLVNIYPWFSAARAMLCRRLIEVGGWSKDELANTLLHISDPAILRPLVTALQAPEGQNITPPQPTRKKRVAGGDFFSREDYDKVKDDDGDVFKRMGMGITHEKGDPQEIAQIPIDYITETLAQIYAEQGYITQAKEIYEKLILAYPKKSAYFAALIEKLNS